MPAQCATVAPKNLSSEELEKRNQAIEIAKKAIDDITNLGYGIHLCYSKDFFFLEKRVS